MAKLYVLGAGGPVPNEHRFGTSMVVQLDDECLMFDCGPAATYKLVRMGLEPLMIDYLFFTHHHFDHNADYACFLLARWDVSIGQENELRVFGPPPTATITERLIGEEGAYAFDWQARVNHPLSQRVHQLRGGTLPRKPPTVNVADVEPGLVVQGRDWQVTAAVGDHVQPWLTCFAYRLDTSRGSIVFTGDTGPTQPVQSLAQGADVMVGMCGGSQQSQIDRGIGYGQMGTIYVGQMAQNAGVRRLVLTHIGPQFSQPGNRELGIIEIGHVYDGEIIYGEEMRTVELW